jgi:hypothetical protein
VMVSSEYLILMVRDFVIYFDSAERNGRKHIYLAWIRGNISKTGRSD